MIVASSVLLLSNVIAPELGTGLPGQNGYGLLSPIFCGTGGAGGPGNSGLDSVSGGNGGNGFYGCGGGGGGAYAVTNTQIKNGGLGGNGGDGLVIITTSI